MDTIAINSLSNIISDWIKFALRLGTLGVVFAATVLGIWKFKSSTGSEGSSGAIRIESMSIFENFFFSPRFIVESSGVEQIQGKQESSRIVNDYLSIVLPETHSSDGMSYSGYTMALSSALHEDLENRGIANQDSKGGNHLPRLEVSANFSENPSPMPRNKGKTYFPSLTLYFTLYGKDGRRLVGESVSSKRDRVTWEPATAEEWEALISSVSEKAGERLRAHYQ